MKPCALCVDGGVVPEPAVYVVAFVPVCLAHLPDALVKALAERTSVSVGRVWEAA